MKITSYIKKNALGFVAFTLANLVAAINFNMFMKPNNLVSGGAGGLALVLSNYFPLSTSDLISIIYLVTLILSICFLDKKTVIGIIYASIIYPVFVYLTEDIVNLVHFNFQDMFLICIISGIISGVTTGTVFKYRLSSGGLSVITLIMNKYFKLAMSWVNFVINAIVVIMGAYFYGFNIVLYAIVLLYISSLVCNNVILGASRNKVMFIRSSKNQKISKFLYEKYHINVTVLDSVGSKTLLAVIKNIDYLRIKRDLHQIDKKVFWTTSDCYEVGKP